jgi:hypothetical protein
MRPVIAVAGYGDPGWAGRHADDHQRAPGARQAGTYHRPAGGPSRSAWVVAPMTSRPVPAERRTSTRPASPSASPAKTHCGAAGPNTRSGHQRADREPSGVAAPWIGWKPARMGRGGTGSDTCATHTAALGSLAWLAAQLSAACDVGEPLAPTPMRGCRPVSMTASSMSPGFHLLWPRQMAMGAGRVPRIPAASAPPHHSSGPESGAMVGTVTCQGGSSLDQRYQGPLRPFWRQAGCGPARAVSEATATAPGPS